MYASPKVVITQFLSLPGDNRVINVIERIKTFSEEEVKKQLENLTREFGSRHRNIEEIFDKNFNQLNERFSTDLANFTDRRKLLLGAFFTKEYSIEAAALFNPSIVPHPDQNDLNEGDLRFIMSMRATGEGHISSIVFSTGIIDATSCICPDPPTAFVTSITRNKEALYDKEFIKERTAWLDHFDAGLISSLPSQFTAKEALTFLQGKDSQSVEILKDLFDSNYEIISSPKIPIREKVIFPAGKAESMGMEDVRFVRFHDNGLTRYYGTYTAYDGRNIKSQLIETEDFQRFKIRTLYGSAVSDKGMALFPEKVNGKYVMVSRQGGEKVQIMFSDNLYRWDRYQSLLEPLYDWELLQLGNCGAPVKTEKGWLLLTHGVGAMRKYVISAVLLDLKDPSVVLGRLEKPLIEADQDEREGYVPNVVYTCGLLLHNNTLIIPYAVSDSAIGFATIALNAILDAF
jgi:predicted GH43/DUF377 family glycosyl hydrolase